MGFQRVSLFIFSSTKRQVKIKENQRFKIGQLIYVGLDNLTEDIKSKIENVKIINRVNNENFNEYYDRKTADYFFQHLKSFADTSQLTPIDFIDWGNNETYVQEIGIGECAGVVIDLIATLFLESEEKIEKAKESHQNEGYSNAIYHAYSSLVNSAKAMLLSEDISTNSHANIIQQFDECFISSEKISLETPFSTLIYQIQKHKPTGSFSEKYIQDASYFLQKVRDFRSSDIAFSKNILENEH